MREVTLHWSGPHHLRSQRAISAFSPPAEPGVYVWLVGTPRRRRVTYVGSSGNLRQRFYQHFVWTLGGGSWLWDVSTLRRGLELKPVYEIPMRSDLRPFLHSHETLSRLAYENLRAYEYLWATIPGGKEERESLESALWDAANEQGVTLQNERTPRAPSRCPRTRYRCHLPHGVTIRGLPFKFTHGTL